jgi:hypothetical protein
MIQCRLGKEEKGRFVRKERMDVGDEENLNHIGEAFYFERVNDVSMMCWRSGYPPYSCFWDGAPSQLHAC